MKNITVLLLVILLMLPYAERAAGAEKVKTKVSYVRRKGELVEFSVTSSKPFIFGSNKYYLHVGDREFTRAAQSKSNGKGRLTFLIPEEDFRALKEGAGVYLTYGNPNVEDGASYEDLSKINSARCWSLGKFSRSMLAK